MQCWAAQVLRIKPNGKAVSIDWLTLLHSPLIGKHGIDVFVPPLAFDNVTLSEMRFSPHPQSFH